mgnify:FL=1
MNRHKEQVFSPYSKEQLYDLIMDVGAYPEFLPWCLRARVISQKDGIVDAELTINFKAFTYSYISEISVAHGDGYCQINVKQKKGPFKNLLNIWHLQTEGTGTRINFTIECELKNPFLDGILRVFFDLAYKQMMSAFIKRAKEIYSA